MSDDQKPEWPTSSKDFAAFGKLVDWLEDEVESADGPPYPIRLHAEHEDWLETSDDDYARLLRAVDDGDHVTEAEKTMLLNEINHKAKAGRRWLSIARHLQGGSATPKFVKLIGLLIEYNAISAPRTGKPKQKASAEQKFVHLASSIDLVLIDRILRREYSVEVSFLSEATMGRYTSRIAEILRGTEEGDEKRHRSNSYAIAALKKDMNRPAFLLRELVGYIKRAATQG
ncbi:hypothetical protein J2046_002733 [Rhizobium petrolearium]|uniref:hypothetical protein n=1 Tax=Neorhizobium petrolearium TaxID=515361 RepID=UPI001AE555DD|nr:hypothetical protein [Neorhizobium petrolearium]MBP1844474.1 hypothetical protein [Neorhizobium petrolearium]